MTIARVLTIAGSDSGGGAGIQGDIKTITALGGYAASAITALTAQNTLGVFGIHDVPDDFIEQQIRLVLDDIGADAIKTGMLHKKSVIQTIAAVLQDYPHIPLIVDPVMLAKGGASLLEEEAIEILINRLIGKAKIITPNIPEAEFLLKNIGSERKIVDLQDMQYAGEKLMSLGSEAVLLKGGHLQGEQLIDYLIYKTPSGDLAEQIFSSQRIDTIHTHGTGCTLASAIATFIAKGINLNDAVANSRDYVNKAIMTAPMLGKGCGPLNHLIK
ncbi:MAG: bifunctional hydroxymethylpyrimidine kinase/phosphomethylpyrimidine kinase [Pseudomonadota bacterium]